jgi:DNA repair exonuclease SbcCD ATPase subunit
MGRMGGDASGDGADELSAAVAELYGLPPGEFTGARNERAKTAKSAGDKELSQAIGRLRKPSTAAWLLNQMVRHHPDEIDQFLAIGSALREAQADLDADQLRQLSRQRHQVVAAVARQARALARQLGHPVSDTVEAEVEQTLRAALADEDAAAAISGGQLTKTLDYAGLGDTRVDLTDAVAVPGAAPPPRPSGGRPPDREPAEPSADAVARRRAELEQAQQDADEAERAAAEAEQAADDAGRRADEAETRRRELQDRITELERQLEQAREDLADTGREARTAARDRDAAVRRAQTAQAQADKAHARVTRLRDAG